MYRYNPEQDKFPYIKNYIIKKPIKDIMVLDLLHLLKEQDESISYRRSCREGVCGSDGMNINGKNGLACITPISSVLKNNKIELRPLPGLQVIRDLVVDMTEFYAQYEKIKPFLQNSTTAPEQESDPIQHPAAGSAPSDHCQTEHVPSAQHAFSQASALLSPCAALPSPVHSTPVALSGNGFVPEQLETGGGPGGGGDGGLLCKPRRCLHE